MPAFKRPLVIGVTGQLGHDVVRVFADVAARGLSHDDIRIEERDSVQAAFEQHQPDLVINTAAFHNVPLCETEQRQALLVNVLGIENLALECAGLGIPLVTFSTDYVFDGTKGSPYSEDDEPRPVSVYGLSKLAGEMSALALHQQTYVLRTSGLYGRLGSKTKGYTFIDRILRQAETGEEIKVVTDMIFSPSYTGHVAAQIRAIVEGGGFGLYHVTNAGSCSWFEFAQEALRQAGLLDRITPIRSQDWPSKVRRPPNSSLANRRMALEGLPAMPTWQQGIAHYLEERALAHAG